MSEHPETKERSERLLSQMLRELPLRRAPATLESRVLGELQRRASLPWWRRGFEGWPVGARGAFVAICGAIIGFTFLEGSWSIAGTWALDAGMSWTYPAVAAIVSAGEFTALLARVVPPTWLYGVLGVGAMLYAALFGLGAVAYRMLYLQPMASDRL